MNDEELQMFLEAGFKAMDTTPDDVERSTRQVMERKTHVRRRSRWLPFPVRHRRPQSPATTDTTAFQPSPVPATNGHTPTVFGRTQIMFSPAKAVTASVIVFVIGGVMLVAQPFQQESGVPGAATDVVVGSAGLVSGTQLTTTISDPVSDEPLTGMKERSRGRTAVYEWTMDDPRLSGTVTVTRNIDRWWVDRKAMLADGDDMAIFWGSVSVENEDGTWAGTFVDADGGPRDENGGPLGGGLFQSTGAGAYEGWSAILHSHRSTSPSDYPPETLVGGMVFPGDLPPDR